MDFKNIDVKGFYVFLTALKSNVQANLPIVTGRMKMNTRAFMGHSNSQPNAILGRMEIDVPYAEYVNYGYETHPRSQKLKRDYMIVEKTVENFIRAVAQAQGGRVK